MSKPIKGYGSARASRILSWAIPYIVCDIFLTSAKGKGTFSRRFVFTFVVVYRHVVPNNVTYAANAGPVAFNRNRKTNRLVFGAGYFFGNPPPGGGGRSRAAVTTVVVPTTPIVRRFIENENAQTRLTWRRRCIQINAVPRSKTRLFSLFVSRSRGDFHRRRSPDRAHRLTAQTNDSGCRLSILTRSFLDIRLATEMPCVCVGTRRDEWYFLAYSHSETTTTTILLSGENGRWLEITLDTCGFDTARAGTMGGDVTRVMMAMLRFSGIITHYCRAVSFSDYGLSRPVFLFIFHSVTSVLPSSIPPSCDLHPHSRGVLGPPTTAVCSFASFAPGRVSISRPLQFTRRA